MAANQKTVYVTGVVSGEGNRMPYQPGDVVSGKLPDHAIASLSERGLVTTSESEANRARSAEADRQAHVAEQIAERSEKRGGTE